MFVGKSTELRVDGASVEAGVQRSATKIRPFIRVPYNQYRLVSDCTLLRISKFFFPEMLDISASDLWVAQLCVGRHCIVPEDLDVVICSQDAPRVSDAVAIIRHSNTKSVSYH